MAFIEKAHYYRDTRAMLGFLIVLLAFAILWMFVQYHDNMVASNTLQYFIVLVAVELGLLASLMFLSVEKKSGKLLKAHSPSKSSKNHKKKKK